MKSSETRTVSLKLVNPPVGEFQKTSDIYLQVLNFTSQYVFKKKSQNPIKLHHALYEKIRKKFKLKSQMTQSCFRQVSGAYRTAKKNGYKWEEPIVFGNSSVLLNYPRDFGINGDTLSINTLSGRKKVQFVCGDHQRSYLDNGWKIHSARLVRRRKDYYLNVAVTKEFKVPDIDDRVTIIGVDLGINNIAVASVADGDVHFAKGGEVKNKKNHYERVQGSLQSKGTRPAKRTLVKLSGRERRFVTDVNHQVSKGLVRWASGFEKPVIALEDLSNIRKRLGIKDGNTNKGRSRKINRWSYYQLRTFVEYKAHELGIPVVYVSPAYTSQKCPKCGHVQKENRDGSCFRCLACRYHNNSDVVASYNIRSKATDSRYTLESAGSLSMTPEVSSDDAETNFVRIDAEGRHKPLP